MTDSKTNPRRRRAIALTGALAFALLLSAPLAWSQSARAGDKVYAKFDNVQVRDTSRRTLATVSAGTEFVVVAPGRPFYEVKLTDGRQGLVSYFQIQEDQPRASGLGGVLRGDRDIAEMRTGSGARGLSAAAVDLSEDGDATTQAVAAVRAMESTAASISNAQVEAFASQLE
ncbi:MAG: hypothetical protein RLY93_10035 [Sumerlaeia bacterium]